MKLIHLTRPVAAAAALFLLAGTGFSSDVKGKPERTQYVVEIKGMSCPFCAYSLEKKLKRIENAAGVSIDLNAGKAVITAKPGKSIDEKVIREIIREAGFDVASIKKLDKQARETKAESS